jgi:ElaB/YqjD/DUF883 family membrane-anchored ribosome-binding protein
MRIHHITSHPPMLIEHMLMEHMLLEYESFGRDQLAPAFAQLYEQVKQREQQRAVTDRMIQEILDHHQGYMQVALKTIQQHSQEQKEKSGSFQISAGDRLGTPAQNKSALATVKNAMQELGRLATRSQPLVRDPQLFLNKKTREIESNIKSQIADNSKFGKHKKNLQRMIVRLKELSKTHPKKTALIVAAIGVIAGLVTGLGPLAGGPITLILKSVLMVINGESFGSAVRKVLTTTGVSILAGFGIGAVMSGIDALFNTAEVAAPISSGDAADPLSQTDAVRERPGTGSTPSSPAAGEAQPVASTPYIDQLTQLTDPTGEGTGIPTMNQEKFADAFRAARQAMGSGNIFIWNGEPYSTKHPSRRTVCWIE